MKEIKAVIRPSKLAALREALRRLPDFPGMTVSKAEGCTSSLRHGPAVNIKDELTDYTPKVRIEIVAPDELSEAIFDCIVHVAQTGQVGDGLVWVTDVQQIGRAHV